MRKLVLGIVGVFLLPFFLGTALLLTARYYDRHTLPLAPLPNALILDNVNIVPISQEETLLNQRIVIDDGRIIAIEPAGSPFPEHIRVVDMDALHATPGLIDMHVHIDDREQLRLSLSYGVTTVRNMDGMPFHLRWREELKGGEWLGSRLYSASPSLHGKKYSSFIDINVQDENHAEHLSKVLFEEGWDFIKVYSGLGEKEFNALVNDSGRSRLPVVGHIPYEVVAADYSRSAEMNTVEHVEEIFQGPLDHSFDEIMLGGAVKTLAQAHAVVCPTLSTFENLTRLSVEKDKYLDQLSTSHMTPFGEFFQRKMDVERWLNAPPNRGEHNIREFKFLKKIVKRLNDSGVRLVLGTDSGTNFVQAGPSMFQEIRLMFEAGMDSHSILESATLNPAIALNIDHDYGSIEVGKMADFVVTRENPLDELSALANPEGVVVAGNLMDREALKNLRSRQGRVVGWWVSIARYFEAVWVRATRY